MAKQEINIKNIDTIGDYGLMPVPEKEQKSTLNIMLVSAGWIIAVSSLYIGGTLGLSMPFGEAVRAAILGQLIVAVIATLMGMLGAKYKVSTTLIARHAFGKHGSAIFGLVAAISLGIGWFAWQASFFGMTVNTIFGANNFWLFEPKVASIWGGLLMFLTAYYGYKGLAALSYLAIPLIFILTTFGATIAVESFGGNLHSIADAQPIGSRISLIAAISSVMGGSIAGGIFFPDLTRYARGGYIKGSLYAGLGYFVGGTFCIISGIIMSASVSIPGVGDVANIPAIMKVLGLGIGGLMVLVLGQWTTNDNNLYTGSVGLINVFNISKKLAVVIMAAIGITISAMNIQDYFVPFLIFLGTYIPPLAGVVLADHWILRGLLTRDSYKFGVGTEYSKWNIVALISALLGGYISTIIKLEYVSILSILMAGAIYLLIILVLRVVGIKNYTIGKWTEGA